MDRGGSPGEGAARGRQLASHQRVAQGGGERGRQSQDETQRGGLPVKQDAGSKDQVMAMAGDSMAMPTEAAPSKPTVSAFSVVFIKLYWQGVLAERNEERWQSWLLVRVFW